MSLGGKYIDWNLGMNFGAILSEYSYHLRIDLHQFRAQDMARGLHVAVELLFCLLACFQSSREV